MANKEIENHKQKLIEILANDESAQRLNDLKKLAKIIGACVTRMRAETTPEGLSIGPSSNIITETEIVHNIQVALQTATMINMCKTSSRNFWIALIATIVAMISAVAAWVAVGSN